MAFAESRSEALLTLALVESIGLNIELIELIMAQASPEVRKARAFRRIISRVEALKENRRFLMGADSDGEEPPAWQ